MKKIVPSYSAIHINSYFVQWSEEVTKAMGDRDRERGKERDRDRDRDRDKLTNSI